MIPSILPSHCWVLTGDLPGPSVVVLGGVHGDERTGVEVVRLLRERFSLSETGGLFTVTGLSGTLTLLLGNPEAIALNRRSVSETRDLNRCFIEEDLERAPSSDDSADLIRAREIAPVLAGADFVFDLHATSSDSPPFMVCGDATPACRAFFRLLPIQWMLTDPDHILAQDLGQKNRGTTDAYVDAHGGVAMGYETGHETDLSRVPDVCEDVVRLLDSVGVRGDVLGRPTALPKQPLQQVYALTHSVSSRMDGFTYAPKMDSGWQQVQKDQLIGVYADGGEERAPANGMLLFPKAAHKVRKGANLYYLARHVISS